MAPPPANALLGRTQWPNGKHQLLFDPPDLFHIYIHGPVFLEEAQEAMKILREEVIPKANDVYFIVHMSKEAGGEAMPRETRKYFSTIDPFWRGSVAIGGSRLGRVAANVFLRAMVILSGKDLPMKVVQTEEEGLEYIQELRVRHAPRA